ncbi:hypothetical protein [Microvirga tunisiensis]|jgi:hypothetical protein|uniref:Uncharacterized protein n=1 Tax=Microvirga tunisiensis TaxID=2108360 RepID=A0A5N7MQ50_9HYPH|nr:hypothetical protein [Microvirga tunisiensis]MPR11031.1 hypothetical protein [Microvirga tunisiensis]MPR29147.1 hypothetical protein [Microvirga tunisiensis]
MSAQALLDLSDRRPARRPGTRRAQKRPSTPLTRNALIADYLALCELDAEMESLRAPADPAEFTVGDETIAHVADFEIVKDGAAYLVDVVTDDDLLQHPLRAAAIHGITSSDGRPFLIETAASIRAEPRFTTMRLIMACKRTPVTAGDRVRVLHQLDEMGTMRLVDCASAVMNTQDGVAAVLALACEGLIAVDTSRPILPETQVRRRRLPYTDPFAF